MMVVEVKVVSDAVGEVSACVMCEGVTRRLGVESRLAFTGNCSESSIAASEASFLQ